MTCYNFGKTELIGRNYDAEITDGRLYKSHISAVVEVEPIVAAAVDVSLPVSG